MTSIRPGSGAMFDRIANRYDLLNRIVALGMDQSWRRRTIAALSPGPGHPYLDVATGTGDLVLTMLQQHPQVVASGLDPSSEMLAICRRKAARLGVGDRLALSVGDGQALPYPTSSFAGVSIGFGIRNVPDRQRALTEMARVTRPGGRIAILELSEPRRGPLALPARFYIRQVVPRLGGLLSGSGEYRYLQQSVAAFPPPDEFARVIESSGIDLVESVPLTCGVCHLFVGTPRSSGQ
jgi:demethylmenaquinone methyltransferase/2-methoxy-6-polyprenyl-1,4-benzoquinol methylase